MSKPGGPWQARGVFMMAVGLIAGCVFILLLLAIAVGWAWLRGGSNAAVRDGTVRSG